MWATSPTDIFKPRLCGSTGKCPPFSSASCIGVDAEENDLKRVGSAAGRIRRDPADPEREGEGKSRWPYRVKSESDETATEIKCIVMDECVSDFHVWRKHY